MQEGHVREDVPLHSSTDLQFGLHLQSSHHCYHQKRHVAAWSLSFGHRRLPGHVCSRGYGYVRGMLRLGQYHDFRLGLMRQALSVLPPDEHMPCVCGGVQGMLWGPSVLPPDER